MPTPSQYWYIACESQRLATKHPVSAQILDQWIVCFRDQQGRPVAFPDRCLHRCGRLSRGSVGNGELTCSYHGWTYDGTGHVVCIPSEGGRAAASQKQFRTTPYGVCECDGYVYVRLDNSVTSIEPFPMPHYHERGWQNLRLVHDFQNTVANCVENFIDVPHTAFVHPGIFRANRGSAIDVTVLRRNGQVHVTYKNEVDNLGSYTWFLNPHREPVRHTDSFFVPNVTHVAYSIGNGERVAYLITSQSVPTTAKSTRVYTDITYRFGRLSWLARPIARRQAKKVIQQDVDELNEQMKVIDKYGQRFIDSPADRIHKLVSQICDALERGEDPTELPDHESSLTFWV